MSIFELVDYDRLLDRIGIPHGKVQNPDGTWTDLQWFCGANPPQNFGYDEVGITFDDTLDFNGRSQHNPAGLCLTADVNVNGLTLNTRDSNGTLWLCTGVEGWWTLPPSEIPDVPKPYWDGSMVTTGRYASRMVTVTGCFIPPGPEWVWYNREAILRCCSLVRGVGLLALCGNQSPENTEMLTIETKTPDPEFPDDRSKDKSTYEKVPNPFYDPAKMAMIQVADTPLVETVRPNGFTQFSLSFKCAYATKEAIVEKNKLIPIPIKDERPIGRAYKSFSLTQSGLPAGTGPDTSYTELQQILNDPLKFRKYSDVEFYNPDSLIPDENEDHAYPEGARPADWIFRNTGSYFAFPTIVFEETRGISLATDKLLTLNNYTTKETLKLVKPIPAAHWLVVDSAARRVALVSPELKDRPGNWLWNARDYLALDSEWITLASGDNDFYVQKDGGVVIPFNQPTMYWRDSWIG